MSQKDPSESTHRAFWLYWTLATTVGGAAAGGIFFALRDSYPGRELTPSIGFLFLLAGLSAFPLGTAQSLVLWRPSRSAKQWLPTAALWILSCFCGCLIGSAVGLSGFFVWLMAGYVFGVGGGGELAVFSHPATPILWVVLPGLFTALSMSALQQRVLSSRFAVASGWTAASALSWFAAWCSGFAAGHFAPVDNLPRWIIGGAVAGFIGGVFTGRILSNLLLTSQDPDEESVA